MEGSDSSARASRGALPKAHELLARHISVPAGPNQSCGVHSPSRPKWGRECAEDGQYERVGLLSRQPSLAPLAGLNRVPYRRDLASPRVIFSASRDTLTSVPPGAIRIQYPSACTGREHIMNTQAVHESVRLLSEDSVAYRPPRGG